jgi:hypothetical protein
MLKQYLSVICDDALKKLLPLDFRTLKRQSNFWFTATENKKGFKVF